MKGRLSREDKTSDKDTFVKLVKAHEASMYRVARGILNNDEDCLDAIQCTIVMAYEAVPTLKFREYFKTWLIRILINECIRIVRQRKKELPLESEALDFFDSGCSFDEVSRIDLNEALNSLEKDLHIIVLLYYFEDLSIKHISRMLGIPEGTVKSRLSRARSILRDRLQTVEGGISYGK